MIDSDCVDSVLLSKPGSVDDMWVWAVDPDYNQAGDATSPSSKDNLKEEENGYKGYLRVRLQQLSNNFLNARRFHEDEDDYSTKALWEAAQKSRNKAFVSVKDERLVFGR